MITLKTINQGQRAAIWNINGTVKLVDGPKRIILFREHLIYLEAFAANPDEYLKIEYKDGRTENIPGPVTQWFDPLEHEKITIITALKIDANEALVVYKKIEDGVVKRRLVRGPAQFVPAADEWLHQFRWHGADPKNPTRKIPRALQFTMLRVIPDQMYVDIPEVRTADDALLLLRIMVFFELRDIERMLDQTHDPVADFINAVTADIIDFAATHTFEKFKEHTEELNALDTYKQLVQRAERIGYTINKVVYRGYEAGKALQEMHDNAIEIRTKLKLEAETENQAQELIDMKLAKEVERQKQKQDMEKEKTVHEQKLKALEKEEMLRLDKITHDQKLDQQKQENALKIDHLKAQNHEQLEYYQGMKEAGVDITRYLVAQYQNPDKIIRFENAEKPQLHLHEGKGA